MKKSFLSLLLLTLLFPVQVVMSAENGRQNSAALSAMMAKSITVTAPNGGENYQAGRTKNITWTSSEVTNVLIEYSTDNGTSWNQVVASVSAATGSYAWSVPAGVSSNSALIKITDVSDAGVSDVSNSVFNLKRLNLVSPLGGEYFQVDRVRQLSWLTGNVGAVTIQYKLETEANYRNISATSQTNFNWLVPYVNASNAVIKISDVTDPTIFDSTTSPIVIGKLDLSFPNGGQNFRAGTNNFISWDAYSSIINLKLEYSTNNGTTWNSIVNSTPASNGFYTWSVPYSISSDSVKIRISDAASNFTISAQSSSFLKIGSLKVTAPNGSENWKPGENRAITWSAGTNISPVTIAYTTDGSTYNTIVTGVAAAAGTYTWSIPSNLTSNTVRIKISDGTNTSFYDEGDTTFRIANVTLTAPNGGEKYQVGKMKVISWTPTSAVANVDLYYSTNNGSSWSLIVSGLSASLGTYSWTIPNASGTNSRVKVVDAASNNQISDSSDAVFTITQLKITTPLAGDTLVGGSVKSVQWSRSSDISAVDLLYSSNAGSTWNTIATNVSAASGGYNWTVPKFINSNQVRLRILNFNDQSIADTTGNFTLYYPSISLLSPNGGEFYQAGSSYNITWTSSFLESVSLAYSLDSGATFSTIIANTPAASGSYSWTIPTTLSSAKALIRISDPNNVAASDLSDNAFKIGRVALISPDGGEKWQAGITQPITWTASSSVSSVKLEYSLNNGSTWITIAAATNAATGSYNWSVPSSSSSEARIRISDAGSNGNIFDVSSNTFTIASLALTSPVGGEEYQSGKSYNITWTSSSSISNVKLEYSTNNGNSWSVISGSVNAAAGTFSWVIPELISSSLARVKVSDADAPAINDSSSATFRIKQLVLTTPNGGEFWQSGTTQTVRWSSGAIASVKLEYSADNGVSWNLITAGTNAVSGQFNWLIPNIASSSMLVRISDASNSVILDRSDALFQVGTLTLLTPNGGEDVQAGKNYAITWTSSSAINTVKIEYSTNNGVAWSQIAGIVSASAGSYTWAVPASLSSAQALIKITDNANTSILDSSDAVFKIKSVRITSPNGGEVWQIGSTQRIKWSTSQITNVKIEYSTNNGTAWSIVNNSVPASNDSIAFVVPNLPTSNALIRISDASNSAISDVSDTTFRFGSLTVSSPNGNEDVQSGRPYTITWVNSAGTTNLKLEYSTNAGNDWSVIASSVDGTTGTYTWNVPSGITSLQGRVRISDANNSSFFDISDNNFKIKNLVVLAPNGNENIQVGKSQQISWTAGNISNVRLEYTTDNGTSWVLISNSVTAGAPFNWTIPNATTALGKIRVSDASNLSIFDISDTTFQIGNIVVQSPNGGENFQVGRTKNITWTSSANIPRVNLAYSTNNGGTWVSIENNVTATSGTYAWVVPNTTTVQGRVRVSDAASNLAVTDSSDAVFTITLLNTITPAGGENWTGGTTQTIRWNASNDISRINMKYSADSGATWNRVADSVLASTGQYSWIVPPSVNSSRSLFRMSNIADDSIYTISNAFTIFYPSIAITAPNGGEDFQAGRQTTITWTQNRVNTVKLEYSTNNGAAWAQIVASVPANSGSFAWSIPDSLSSSVARVRITSTEDSLVQDASDNTFFITRLKVLTPIAGEFIQAGQQKTIRWSASTFAGNLKLEYSLNNGQSWILIDNLIPATQDTFNWAVPQNITGTNSKIRLSLSSNASIFDTTTGSFKIGYVTVLAPNGGENIQAGKSYLIRYTNSNSISNVRIDYSPYGDSGYVNIVSSIAASGSYLWSVPSDLFTIKGRIRVSDAESNLQIGDKSDTLFSVTRLHLLAPIAGDNWGAGTAQTIRWISSPNITSLRIEYSTNNGLSWDTVRTTVPATDSVLSWQIPVNLSSSQSRIKIQANNFSNIVDTSGVFTIFIPTVSVVYPNGGEFLQAGKTSRIRWNASFVANIKIEFSVNNGQNWTTLSNSTNASLGFFDWAINPGLNGAQAFIRISDISNAGIKDSSDGNFKIGNVVLSSPNGGENLLAGSTQNITWVNSASVTAVNLEYSVDSTWLSIVSNISVTGNSYPWVVPTVPSTQARIRISDAASGLQINDTSNARFTISVLTVNTPNGGEFLQAGQSHTITWSRSTNISNVKIEVSPNNGGNWVSVTNSTPASSGEFTWAIPLSFFSDSVKIRVSDVANLSIRDESDNTFRVGALQIVAANGGEKLLVGARTRIIWNASSNISVVDLHYSTDKGQVWLPVALGYSADSLGYNWTVPDTPGDSVLLRIRNSLNITFTDQSNNVFTISRMQLTSPNGGQVYQTGTTQVITWQSKFVTTIALEYSTNTGRDWSSITGAYPADSARFIWSIPDDLNIASPNYILRIRDIASANIADTSNNNFAVSYLKLISPNGGGGQLIGTSYLIKWQHSGSTIDDVKLEYTTNNGLSWNSIVSSFTADSAQYLWKLPNTPAPECRVRVSDVDNPTIRDISDSTFIISSLQLTYPTAANIKMQTGKKYTITWDAGFVTRIKLEYSLNGGSDWNDVIGASSLTASTGRFEWTAVNVPSRSVLIRVKDVDIPSIYDVSDTTFSITSLRVNAPNSLFAVPAGSSYKVEWQTQFIDTVRVLLSLDGGSSYPFNLATIKADSGSYQWSVPNVKTLLARIKITDKNDLNLSDESDTNFAIIDYPRLVSMKQYQKDTVGIIFNLPNPGEIVTLTKLEYESSSTGLNDATNAVVGNYSNMVSPLADTLLWNTRLNLSNFEGKVKAKLTFNSNYNVTYTVSLDTLGIDNKAPTVDLTSLNRSQDPYKLGWSNLKVSHRAAADSSLPITYYIYLSDSAAYGTVPTFVTVADTFVLAEIRSSTGHKMKIEAKDALGNSSVVEMNHKSPAVSDFNNDGFIDITDLASFVKSWSSADSLSAADMAPYLDSLPKARIKGDKKLDVEDILVFVNMWNYFQQNRILPKSKPAALANAERKPIRMVRGENKISFPIDLPVNVDLRALSVELITGNKSVILDSITVKGLSAQALSLGGRDTLDGYYSIAVAELSSKISNNLSLEAKMTGNLKISDYKDSLYLIIRGFDGNASEVINRNMFLSVTEVPASFALYQNYPNPFNPSTTIMYELPQASGVSLQVYDVLGRLVTTLIDEQQSEGVYKYIFDANKVNNGLASGVYFYRLKAGQFTSSKKLILVK